MATVPSGRVPGCHSYQYVHLPSPWVIFWRHEPDPVSPLASHCTWNKNKISWWNPYGSLRTSLSSHTNPLSRHCCPGMSPPAVSWTYQILFHFKVFVNIGAKLTRYYITKYYSKYSYPTVCTDYRTYRCSSTCITLHAQIICTSYHVF